VVRYISCTLLYFFISLRLYRCYYVYVNIKLYGSHRLGTVGSVVDLSAEGAMVDLSMALPSFPGQIRSGGGGSSLHGSLAMGQARAPSNGGGSSESSSPGSGGDEQGHRRRGPDLGLVGLHAFSFLFFIRFIKAGIEPPWNGPIYHDLFARGGCDSRLGKLNMPTSKKFSIVVVAA
jgi:hypothetical protein